MSTCNSLTATVGRFGTISFSGSGVSQRQPSVSRNRYTPKSVARSLPPQITTPLESARRNTRSSSSRKPSGRTARPRDVEPTSMRSEPPDWFSLTIGISAPEIRFRYADNSSAAWRTVGVDSFGMTMEHRELPFSTSVVDGDAVAPITSTKVHVARFIRRSPHPQDAPNHLQEPASVRVSQSLVPQQPVATPSESARPKPQE